MPTDTLEPDYAEIAILIIAVLFPLGVLAAVCYFIPGRMRFSLRTLLIATTLIAVTLGTIAWLAHR